MLTPDGHLRGGSPADLQRAMQLLASLVFNNLEPAQIHPYNDCAGSTTGTHSTLRVRAPGPQRRCVPRPPRLTRLFMTQLCAGGELQQH